MAPVKKGSDETSFMKWSSSKRNQLEKCYWTPQLWLSLAEMRLNVFGNVRNVSGTRVAEFIFLTETLIVDVKVVLNHFKFHLSTISVTLRANCVISRCNSVKTDFSLLSSTFHINSILKLALVLSQELREMQLVRTFCSSTAKTSTVTPICLFHDFDKNSASFQWEKIGKNLWSSFCQFY